MKVYFLGFPADGYPAYFKSSLPDNLEVDIEIYNGWPLANDLSLTYMREFSPDLIVLRANPDAGGALQCSIHALRAIKSDLALSEIPVVLVGPHDFGNVPRFGRSFKEQLIQLGAAAVLSFSPIPETSNVLNFARTRIVS